MDATDGVRSAAAEAALHRLLMVLLTVLVVAGLVPLFAAGIVYRFFHSYRVFALAGGGLVLASIPVVLALRVARRGASADPRTATAALWAACAAAVLASLAAVTVTAQTMAPLLVFQAQRNTHSYVLLQPVAFVVFVVAVGLALSRDAIGTVVTRRSLAIAVIAAKCLAAGLVIAVWFLAGIPPAAFVVKVLLASALVGGAVVLLERVPEGRRASLAWAAALAGCLNLLATLAIFARVAS